MTTFSEILEKIKDIISIQKGNKKVFYKDVAEEMEISLDCIYVWKKRNKIPYKEVLEYALKKRVDVNWLFFGIRTIK